VKQKFFMYLRVHSLLIFTKGLPTYIFEDFRVSLNIVPSVVPTAGGVEYIFVFSLYPLITVMLVPSP
jgi:hypothetical protein